MLIGNTKFEFHVRAYVMGVLNVTPDSFSGDGIMRGAELQPDDIDRALAQAAAMERDGAHVIDVGGQSSRPERVYGTVEQLTAPQEAARVLPVVSALRDAVALPISIDTSRAEVARAALDAGAAMVNDVSMLADPAMAETAKGSALLISHNPRQPYPNPAQSADNAVWNIVADLNAATAAARRAGVAEDRILVDPGVGFGKDADVNLRIVRNLAKMREHLPCPLAIGISRKAFISKIVGGNGADEVETGGIALAGAAINAGAKLIRAHNVARIAAAVAATNALLQTPRNAATTCYVSLGANLGDREGSMRRAIEAIDALPRTAVTLQSRIYLTKPWRVEGQQPDYLNMAIAVATELPLKELTANFRRIERELGRAENSSNQSRTIDVDLLLYGSAVVEVDEPRVRVPHSEMADRAFVLAPLREIAATVAHPLLNATVAELAEEVDMSVVSVWRTPDA